MLHANVEFLLLFIDSKSEAAMRSLQNACGLDVSIRLARKNDYLVSRVRFHRIDVTGLRINVDAVVVLDLGLGPLNDPLWFRAWDSRRCIVEPVEYPKSPVVLVHEDHFVEIQIHSDRAVNRILIADRAYRRTIDQCCLTRFLRTG